MRCLASACAPGTATEPSGISRGFPGSRGSPRFFLSSSRSQSRWNQRASRSSWMSRLGVGGYENTDDPRVCVFVSRASGVSTTVRAAAFASNPTMSWHGNGHG